MRPTHCSLRLVARSRLPQEPFFINFKWKTSVEAYGGREGCQKTKEDVNKEWILFHPYSYPGSAVPSLCPLAVQLLQTRPSTFNPGNTDRTQTLPFLLRRRLTETGALSKNKG